MNKQVSYFKIGAFTLASISLAIIFIILLGVGNLFKQPILIETYFDESVQGLSVGSPVKYRGVNVGKVTAIDLVNQVYGENINDKNDESQRYIYVQFSLSQPLQQNQKNKKNIKQLIDNYVSKGLRTSLATQDFVGNVFLSINFVQDPEKLPMLPISWKPHDLYIPSTPSTLSQLTDNLSNILENFNKINFISMSNDIEQTTLSLRDTIQKTNLLITTQQKTWQDTFDSLHQVSLDLSTISTTLKNNPKEIIFSQPAKPTDPSQ